MLQDIKAFFDREITHPKDLFSLKFLPVTVSLLVLLITIPFSVFVTVSKEPQSTNSNAQEIRTQNTDGMLPTVTTPQEDAIILSQTTQVIGETTPNTKVVVIAKNEPVVTTATATGFFQTELSVDEGPVTLTILTTDEKGNEMSLRRNVYVDLSSKNTTRVVGRIISLLPSTNEFTVETAEGQKTIQVNGATQYARGQSFASLLAGQRVGVYAKVGQFSLLADKVVAQDSATLPHYSLLVGKIKAKSATGLALETSATTKQITLLPQTTFIGKSASLSSTALVVGDTITVLAIDKLDTVEAKTVYITSR